jgi:hypothetical protein
MRYELPTQVKSSLATRAARLHHLLLHAIRNNWHDFTEAERATLRERHPRWVPTHPRFVRVTPTADNPEGIELNFEAGESFLYTHRQMIASVNVQLAALNEPALVPWSAIPAPDDADYPVPGRTSNGPANDIKSDAFYTVLQERVATVQTPEVLRANSLAAVGAYVESAIHDFLHGRWAAVSPGPMAAFPPLNPTNVNPVIPAQFDAPIVDWLGHPWSSHVNADFWKLHGWVDQVAEAWRVAQGLSGISWTDTWQGDLPADQQPDFSPNMLVADRLVHLHDHFEHGHHSAHNLMEVLKTINQFERCEIGFDYVIRRRVPIKPLKTSS